MSSNIETQIEVKKIQPTEVSRPLNKDAQNFAYQSRQQYSKTIAYLMSILKITDVNFLQFCIQGSITTLSNTQSTIAKTQKYSNPNTPSLSERPFLDLTFKPKNIYQHGKDRALISDPQLLAQNHDYILKRIGLISDDLTQIQRLFLIYYPSDILDPTLVLNNILSQIKEKIVVEKLSTKEKEDFLLTNWQKIIKAAVVGINIGEFVNYDDHALKINHNVVITDIDPLSQPKIPFEAFEKFTHPSKDEILMFLQEFIQSNEYKEIKNFKLQIIKSSCAKRSHFYKQYNKSFEKIEQFVSGQSQDYKPINTASSNISSLKFKNGKILKLPKASSINQNFDQKKPAKLNPILKSNYNKIFLR